MIYVGIDIAKLTHYASIMNSDGEILTAPFSFTNDHSGFQKLLQHLDGSSNIILKNITIIYYEKWGGLFKQKYTTFYETLK